MSATQEKSAVDSVPTQLFIGGEWRDASGGATLDVEDPSTGETIASVADATPDDAKAALDACVAVQAEWAAHPPRERGEILRRAWEKITERADDLAMVMTLEMGKPLAESKAEITYASEFFRWFAEEAVRIEGRFATAPNGVGRLITMRQPVGPCYAITPWNFPMAMGTRKIGPAIAAGCTMVIKPAQQTPLSMYALAQILEEAGLPAGVLNVVTSKSSGDVSKPIISDPRLRKLTFTGSTEVGRMLVEQSAEGLLRTSMELGGNAPFLVFEDADVDAAVDGRDDRQDAQHRRGLHGRQPLPRAREGARRVHGEARGEDGRDEGRARRRRRRRGRPADRRDAARQGRRAGRGRHGQGRRRGRRRLRAATAPGYFYEPTVLGGVPDDARLLKEEIFGPVAPVIGFSDEEQAVAAANDTEFGLVSYVYTSDVKRAFRVCEALETGMIGLNQGLVSNPAAPFGGVKASGFGREGGAEGIHEYLEIKYVAMAMD